MGAGIGTAFVSGTRIVVVALRVCSAASLLLGARSSFAGRSYTCACARVTILIFGAGDDGNPRACIIDARVVSAEIIVVAVSISIAAVWIKHMVTIAVGVNGISGARIIVFTRSGRLQRLGGGRGGTYSGLTGSG
jgi:hypothetical protein